MQRRQFLSLLPGGLQPGGSAPQARPNIVLIMADDMGFSDIGCYGGEMKTPNLDALARSGVRFTQFYNTARCCPTRASLLTGMYSHQVGIGHMVEDRGLPAYRGDLSHEHRTVAEVLQGAGYRCYMAGKWHVNRGNAKGKENWPLQRGFEKFYGSLKGGHHYYPESLADGNDLIDPPKQDYYYADEMTRRACGYLRDHTGDSEPFFLYAAFTTPHFPLQCPEDSVSRVRGRYLSGWEEVRHTRFERMRRMGIIDRRWKLPERDRDVAAWTEAPNKDWEQRRMEVYAAMVERMDQRVGEIVAQVRAMGQERNTLFLFLSDNGGSAELMTPRNTVNRVPAHLKTSRRWEGNDPAVMPGPADTYQSYGASWASASNAPFRRYKSMVHEGGISTPLIAAWEGHIGRPGSLNHEPGHVMDLLPSCAELAGARVSCEGISIAAAFAGRRRRLHDAICFEHEGNQAIRAGAWKLVRAHNGPWELYNLEEDRTETNDLSGRDPARVRRMQHDYQAWMARVGAREWNEVRNARAGQ